MKERQGVEIAQFSEVISVLYIQDPTYDGSKLLHEALLEACGSATRGAGTYAFVSVDGVNLLMNDPAFIHFLDRGPFHLVIGMDEITNTRTLSALNTFCEQHINLTVHAFLHYTSGSTFHPKFSWFRCQRGGYLIAGSGNLTQKGLRRNREAYEFSRVSEKEIQAIEDEWSTWLTSCRVYLRNLDDPGVIERAEDNARRAAAQAASRPHRRPPASRLPIVAGAPEAIEPTLYEGDEIGSWEFDEQCPVLIAEIPNAGARWHQANFDARTFVTFFNSQLGVPGQDMLVLRDVKWGGSLGEIQQRPPVSVASHNYRVELSIEGGVQYPDDGRPLGVFVRLSTRTFLYMILFPSDAGHAALQSVLDRDRIRTNRLVRYQTNALELRELCPDLPLLEYLS